MWFPIKVIFFLFKIFHNTSRGSVLSVGDTYGLAREDSGSNARIVLLNNNISNKLNIVLNIKHLLIYIN